jgi:hypothetical protein
LRLLGDAELGIPGDTHEIDAIAVAFGIGNVVSCHVCVFVRERERERARARAVCVWLCV